MTKLVVLLLFVQGLFMPNLLCGQGQMNRIAGITIEAPPKPYDKNPMPDIAQVSANWVVVVPYGFTKSQGEEVIYGEKMYWWGESPQGVRKTIELAHQEGFCVMVKPQVWLQHQWIGDLSFSDEALYAKWWASYVAYIDTITQICDEYGVEMFCIGTEVKQLSTKTADWKALIRRVRSRYKGLLTYAANWDEYEQIAFWNELDFIGINAYFPVLNKSNATAEEIATAWQPTVKKLEHFSNKQGKPILFAEYGFLSVERNTFNTWELEKKIADLPEDEQAQANAFEGLYQAFWHQPFWHGGFIWKWTPNLTAKHPKQYSPQYKLATQTIKRWFQKM